MVTKSRVSQPVLFRYHLGTALIWVGVLIWGPFIVLHFVGSNPPLWWFLPFHLLGVVGGSRLRASACKAMGASAPKVNFVQIVGKLLILIGVLVWAPCLYLKLIAQIPVDVSRFLPFHLAGVLGGLAILLVNYLLNQRGERGASPAE
jgi:hypothetical protein